MMKKILALLLVLTVCIATASLFTGCAGGDSEKKDIGAEIQAYFVGEVYDFDPAKAYTNDDAMKIMSLIYEPLFNLDSEGNLQYGLAKSYRFYTERGAFMLDIELRESYWSDGDPITADDVAYSWQRILAPDFPCQAASLLYEIKNARDAKLNNNTISVENAGIEPQGDTVIITFEQELDEEAQQNFLRNLTSIALAPVDGDAIERNSREDVWAKKVTYLVTSGPFCVRAMDYTETSNALVEGGCEFRLERNNYYRRSQESTSSVTKYVSPAKFMEYWNQDLDDVFASYISNTIFYVGDIPLSQRSTYLAQAKLTNLLSTYTYVLDNNDPLFSDARVRRALSLALDRQYLVDSVTMGLGVPATGFVSHGVYNGSQRGTFSAVTAASDAALSTTANKDAAVALIREAVEDGYVGRGNIRILVRDNEEEIAIAKAITKAWDDLFTSAGCAVTVSYTAKSGESFEFREDADSDPYTLYKDPIQEAYRVQNVQDATTDFGSGYNVLAIDYQMLSTDAFSVLASFTQDMSGNGAYMGVGVVYNHTHRSGFHDVAYDSLMEAAYDQKDIDRRATILHRAEARLLEEMPVIPLLFNQTASLCSSQLQRVYTNYYGYAVLTRAELRNYKDYYFDED